jgi:hypothetical protein
MKCEICESLAAESGFVVCEACMNRLERHNAWDADEWSDYDPTRPASDDEPTDAYHGDTDRDDI